MFHDKSENSDRTIGRYEPVEIVSQRPRDIVYRAIASDTGEEVALKLFVRRELTALTVFQRAELLNEGGPQRALPKARSCGTHYPYAGGRGMAYLAMDWIDGTPLNQRLQAELERYFRPRSLQEAVELLDPVMELLAHAHRLGIYHLNVRSERLLVTGTAINPGVTMLLGLIDGGDPAAAHAYPSERSFAAHYPDHAAAGAWSDVFGLARTMVEIMHPAAAFASLSRSYSKLELPTPRTLGLEVSDQVEELFASAFDENVDRRPRDMGEFRGRLTELISRAPRASAAAAFSGAFEARSSAAATEDDDTVDAQREMLEQFLALARDGELSTYFARGTDAASMVSDIEERLDALDHEQIHEVETDPRIVIPPARVIINAASPSEAVAVESAPQVSVGVGTDRLQVVRTGDTSPVALLSPNDDDDP